MASRCLLIASVLAVLALTSLARAESPKEIIFSDDVLHQAFADIDRMEHAELSAFVRYLAECKDELSSNDLIHHACTVARTLYGIEYGKERSLDKLIRAIEIAGGLLKDDKQNRNPDLVLRYSDVESKLAYITSIRFSTLRDKANQRSP
jgi:hypothetical protein